MQRATQNGRLMSSKLRGTLDAGLKNQTTVTTMNNVAEEEELNSNLFGDLGQSISQSYL